MSSLFVKVICIYKFTNADSCFQAVGGEAGTGHVHAFDAGFGPLGQQHAGVGLQPFGAAKAGLERHRPLVRVQTQPFRDQASGFLTLTIIGIAGQQISLGQPVEGEQQPLAGLIGAGGAEMGGQSVQIAGIVVVLSDEAQFRQPAPGAQFGSDRIEGRGDGSRRVLRV